MVGEVLRVDDGRYWSYLCDTAACCPPEGVAYDPAATEMAAAATYAGHVALPTGTRWSAAASLAPVTGPQRQAADLATEAAARDLAGGETDQRAGVRALILAQRRYTGGGRLPTPSWGG